MPLKGMTLFELSRGQPKTIKVCHAIMCNVQKVILRALPFNSECPASFSLLYHGAGVSGWHWKQLAN